MIDWSRKKLEKADSTVASLGNQLEVLQAVEASKRTGLAEEVERLKSSLEAEKTRSASLETAAAENLQCWEKKLSEVSQSLIEEKTTRAQIASRFEEEIKKTHKLASCLESERTVVEGLSKRLEEGEESFKRRYLESADFKELKADTIRDFKASPAFDEIFIDVMAPVEDVGFAKGLRAARALMPDFQPTLVEGYESHPKKEVNAAVSKHGLPYGYTEDEDDQREAELDERETASRLPMTPSSDVLIAEGPLPTSPGQEVPGEAAHSALAEDGTPLPEEQVPIPEEQTPHPTPEQLLGD